MNVHIENFGKTNARGYSELCIEHSIEFIVYQGASPNG